MTVMGTAQGPNSSASPTWAQPRVGREGWALLTALPLSTLQGEMGARQSLGLEPHWGVSPSSSLFIAAFPLVILLNCLLPLSSHL